MPDKSNEPQPFMIDAHLCPEHGWVFDYFYHRATVPVVSHVPQHLRDRVTHIMNTSAQSELPDRLAPLKEKIGDSDGLSWLKP